MTTTPLKTRVKAETIAAAIYAATGIQPNIIYYDKAPFPQNPVITFSKENAEKLRTFLKIQIAKKSDVDIDFYKIAKPIIIADLLPYIVLFGVGTGAIGYLLGQMH